MNLHTAADKCERFAICGNTLEGLSKQTRSCRNAQPLARDVAMGDLIDAMRLKKKTILTHGSQTIRLVPGHSTNDKLSLKEAKKP